MLRVVVDTSVFVAGFLSTNPSSCPSQIITMWKKGKFLLVLSPQITDELVAKLWEKDVSQEVIVDFIQSIAAIAIHIPGVCETNKLDHVDATDNMFISAAYEAGADYIVSYDHKSLLPLKYSHGTQICTPELFMRMLMPPLDGTVQEATGSKEFESDYLRLTRQKRIRRHTQYSYQLE